MASTAILKDIASRLEILTVQLLDTEKASVPDALVRPSLDLLGDQKQVIYDLIGAAAQGALSSSYSDTESLATLEVEIAELVKHQSQELDIEGGPWHNPPALRRFREMGQAVTKKIAQLRDLRVQNQGGLPAPTAAPSMAAAGYGGLGGQNRDMTVEQALNMLVQKKEPVWKGSLIGIVHAAGMRRHRQSESLAEGEPRWLYKVRAKMGKSPSDPCVQELRSMRGFEPDDPRVIITVIDDDSELHENYFEALSYHYLKASENDRYTTLFQPPIVHFKNFLTQPILVRNASLFTSLHELACLANPVDCHVAFSSYSLSYILASAVQGWDPDFISEDWHMTAKCKLMTEGRASVKPIFLPLMNYAPEEDDAWSTVMSRWTQAKRHALGMSEIVYVATKMYIGMCECNEFWRGLVFIYRMLPLLGKYIAVHFVVATLAFWPLLSHILINFYMWHSWCYIEDLNKSCSECCVPMAIATEVGIEQERIILNSWMVYFQEKANVCFFIGLVIAGSWGAFYFHLVRDRVEGDWYADWVVRNPLFLWGRTWLEVSVLGWISSLAFGSVPEWVAAFRIMFTLQFHHVVAGMVGRKDDDDAIE
eukprot:s1622_g3.t1